MIFQSIDFVVNYLTQSPLEMAQNDLEVAAYLFFTALIYSLPLWGHPIFQWAMRTRPWAKSVPSYYFAGLRTVSEVDPEKRTGS